MEEKKWDVKWSKQVKCLLANGRKKDPAYELGISSFGTIETLISTELNMDIKLAEAAADLNTTGVIGYHLDPMDDNRVIVLFSSAKCGMFMYEELVEGYSNGLYLLDFTYCTRS